MGSFWDWVLWLFKRRLWRWQFFNYYSSPSQKLILSQQEARLIFPHVETKEKSCQTEKSTNNSVILGITDYQSLVRDASSSKICDFIFIVIQSVDFKKNLSDAWMCKNCLKKDILLATRPHFCARAWEQRSQAHSITFRISAGTIFSPMVGKYTWWNEWDELRKIKSNPNS